MSSISSQPASPAVTFMGLIKRDKTAAADDYTKMDIVTEYCPSGDLRYASPC